MPPRRRRNTRLNAANKSQDSSPEPSSETATHVEDNNNESQRSGDDTCPACDANESPLNAAEKESWVRCDACKTWYHWACAGEGGDLEAVDKW